MAFARTTSAAELELELEPNLELELAASRNTVLGSEEEVGPAASGEVVRGNSSLGQERFRSSERAGFFPALQASPAIAPAETETIVVAGQDAVDTRTRTRGLEAIIGRGPMLTRRSGMASRQVKWQERREGT
ncbi:MAG: hypothetical protein V2A73_20700 [Pseudomonadota bacterium]